jgi:fumarate hydratase class II
LNREKIDSYVGNSLMLVTALSPVTGYQNAAHIAEQAAAEGTTLKEAALKSGKVSAEEYDRIIVPRNMIGEGVGGA